MLHDNRTTKMVQDIPLSIKQQLDAKSESTGATLRDIVLEAWASYLTETEPGPSPEDEGQAKLVLDVPVALKQRAAERRAVSKETFKDQILAAIERSYGIMPRAGSQKEEA